MACPACPTGLVGVFEGGFFAFIGAVQVKDCFFEHLGGFGIRGLFALHRGDDHGVGGGQLLGVVFAARFDPLCQEVVGHGVLDLGRVLFLGGDPTRALVD